MPELTPAAAATADRSVGGAGTLWRLTYPIIVSNLAAVT